jgi:hypothetical protein
MYLSYISLVLLHWYSSSYCIFFIILMHGIHCGIYKSSDNVSSISYMYPTLLTLFYHPPQFLERFQQGSFLHLSTCAHSFCIIFTLLAPDTTLPPTPPLPLPPPYPATTGQDLFHSPFSNFVEEKRKKHFCLYSYTGCFLVIFPCMYLFLTPTGSLPLFFLHSTLVPLLWWFQLV